MEIIKYINATLAFALELVMLYLFGNWGYQLGKTNVMKWVIALICVVVIGTVWGIYAAPKSNTRLEYPWLILFESFMLLLPAVLLYIKNPNKNLIIYGALVIVSQVISNVYRFKDALG